MISEDGTRTAWRARLGLWGETEALTRRAANDNAAPDCPIRFQGQWFDEESGLHYNRFRYYDPEAGQYLSPDPIGLAGGTRPQGYVADPNGWIDPLGLAVCQARYNRYKDLRSKGFSAKDAARYSKPYADPRSRPAYGRGQVARTWRNAQDANGRVFDPNTGKELFWDKSRSRAGQWDMGHRTGHEYRELHRRYMDGEISKQQFLDEYRNPGNYYPEDPSSNRSHEFEADW